MLLVRNNGADVRTFLILSENKPAGDKSSTVLLCIYFPCFHRRGSSADLHLQLAAMCVCVPLRVVAGVPLSGPDGDVVGDVGRVCVPLPGGQLFDLQGEVPQRGRARAARHPVDAHPPRLHSVLRDGQLPGRLRALCRKRKIK